MLILLFLFQLQAAEIQSPEFLYSLYYIFVSTLTFVHFLILKFIFVEVRADEVDFKEIGQNNFFIVLIFYC